MALFKNAIIFLLAVHNVEELKKHILSSLHSQSDTRWSATIEAVTSLASHIAGLTKALKELQKLNSTADTYRDINDILSQSLLTDLKFLRDHWGAVLNECNLVSSALQKTVDISAELPSKKVGQKRKRRIVDSDDGNEEEQEIDEETNVQRNKFFVIIDSVIVGFTSRFDTVGNLYDTFNVLWKFTELIEDKI
ncbi:hypothetical protein JTB14_019506 [Gonioctena quinquepunctata]|nr:hypothetical protein JTB14_019506 [Gonioctena quinquepunctata]